MASTISVAPVPGVGFSIRCSGVGPSTMARRKPSRSRARAWARSAAADEGEVAQQVVQQQRARRGDVRWRSDARGPAARRSPAPAGRAAARRGGSPARSAARRRGRTPACATMPASTGRPGSGVASSDFTRPVGGGAGTSSPLRVQPPPIGQLGQHVAQALLGDGGGDGPALVVGHDPGRQPAEAEQPGRVVGGEQHGTRRGPRRGPDRPRRRAARAAGPAARRSPIGRWRPVCVADGGFGGAAAPRSAASTSAAIASAPSRRSMSLKSSPSRGGRAITACRPSRRSRRGRGLRGPQCRRRMRRGRPG